ncbi:MAG TPA: methyl-accepting chemotaxis protein, partial [Mycobacteriales bacterium]|nr:methyl-accepting chemotaxis protein [Mycobacteriales bacterium]
MIERMRGESAFSSGGKYLAAAIAVLLMSHYRATGPTHDHRNLILAWLAVGVASATLVPLYPRIVATAPGMDIPMLVLIAGVDFAALFAVVSLTGGIEGPFWALILVNTTAASVIAPSLALALGAAFFYIGTLVGATALAHTLSLDNVGPLVLVGSCLPLVALLGNSVALRLEQQRTRSDAERDQLHRTVEELSEALALAARGDLSVKVGAGAAAQELLSRLSSSFDYTLGNLRSLVEQIRAGGDQLITAAHELLASAEQHAASATQQSSAVSETTSTIEELAATAAQISETSESV